MANQRQFKTNYSLSIGLYIAIGIILFCGFLGAVIAATRASKADPFRYAESQAPAIKRTPNILRTWIRRRFLLPALFGGCHVQTVGWFVLPTRGQSSMIFLYFILNIVFLTANHPDGRTTKSIADRAGHLAVANMPVFYLFAGRNNILIWITEWPYKDFQVFHKWIARIATLCVAIHGGLYGVKAARQAEITNPRRHFDGKVWWNGVAALSVMAVMVVFSTHPIRARAYEMFLATHIVSAALATAFVYFHVAPSIHPYTHYIWACVVIWATDRSIRLLRLVVLNYGGRNTAKVKLIPGTSAMRLTVYPARQEVGFVPSAHYFIYITDRWCFWESHPFTAASWRSAQPAPEKVVIALEKIKSPADGSGSSNGKDAVIVATAPNSKKSRRAKLTFLIDAKQGMTHHLHKRLMESPENSVEIPCLVEGPYGSLRPVHAFPTVIVIAGGIGISTGLPYLTEYLKYRPDPKRRFLLIWSVKKGAVAEKILKEVRGGLTFRQDVTVRLHITRADKKEQWRFPLGVKVRYRRPDIEETIVKEAKSRVPRTPMAVIACGGGPICDSARRGAVEALKNASGWKGMGDVVYWEDGYN